MIHGGALMAFGLDRRVLEPARGRGHHHHREQTNFLGAAKEGSTIEAEATPLHVSRRSSVWQTASAAKTANCSRSSPRRRWCCSDAVEEGGGGEVGDGLGRGET